MSMTGEGQADSSQNRQLDPFVQVQHALNSWRQEFSGNYVEASFLEMQGFSPVREASRHYAVGHAVLKQDAEKFTRQTQALQAFGGIFFEAANRVYGEVLQAKAPTTAPSSQKTVREAWRQKLENHHCTKSVDIPGASRAIQVVATPLIQTGLSQDPSNHQLGYYGRSGSYIADDEKLQALSRQKLFGTISCLPMPLLAEVKEFHELSKEKQHPLLADDPRRQQRLAEITLRKVWQQLSTEPLRTTTLLDIIAVVPAIHQTDVPIAGTKSVGMCLDLSQNESQKGNSQTGYLVQAIIDKSKDNIRLNDDSQTHFPLGKNDQENPYLTMPRLTPAAKLSSKPFNRETGDMAISVIGIPVQKISSRHHERRPQVANSSIYRNNFDIDRSRSSFIAHVAIIGDHMGSAD